MATNLYKAHDQLFTRNPDESFSNLNELWEHCHDSKDRSEQHWRSPSEIEFDATGHELFLRLNGDTLVPNDWSFTQLCSLAQVHKETVNRLSVTTAARVLQETVTRRERPFQLYSLEHNLRAVTGMSYSRLYNADLLSLALEFTSEFDAPQEAANGDTGLYCGEQDMFAFVIDPTCWAEINGQAFAPGFFLWNSEVGCRSVGIQTFWFQSVCKNHIVWDAIEVVDYSRKHTASADNVLGTIRTILMDLAEKRHKRRKGFLEVIERAMNTRIGDTDEDALGLLREHGIGKALAAESLEIAKEHGGLTIFAVVDALTRISQHVNFAGDRARADAHASQLLALVA